MEIDEEVFFNWLIEQENRTEETEEEQGSLEWEERESLTESDSQHNHSIEGEQVEIEQDDPSGSDQIDENK